MIKWHYIYIQLVRARQKYQRIDKQEALRLYDCEQIALVQLENDPHEYNLYELWRFMR